MSIQRMAPDNFEQFTLDLHPRRKYSSASVFSTVQPEGITGSVKVFPRGSSIEKDFDSVGEFASLTTAAPYKETSTEATYQGVLLKTREVRTIGTTDVSAAMEQYLTLVNGTAASDRRQQQLEVLRHVPGARFDKVMGRKRMIRSALMPYYRAQSPSMNWAFTNYHCLNFFTSSTVPENTVLLYPNSASSDSGGIASGTYALTGAFTFDFYINPRYTAPRQISAPGAELSNHFHAGTIFHMSSTYAISLITGSLVDGDGLKEGFRLQLQLSHSADLRPSEAIPGNFPHDMVFLSDDNSLRRNHWHKVSIVWGTDQIDEGSGSFIIDGDVRGTFVVPSSTIAPSHGLTNPDVLAIGNFYEGNNLGLNAQTLYFSNQPATRDGLVQMDPTTGIDTPNSGGVWAHPLNAEVHELKIYREFLHVDQLNELSLSGPKKITDGLAFYLPPFFVRESPKRVTVNSRGGVLQTPFFAIDSRTDDPFNVAMSFGVGGRDINLENFTRDFATGNYPRLLNLTASQITVTTADKPANEFLWSTASVVKRNLTLLPCDNGKFKPNFRLLLSGVFDTTPHLGHEMDHFVDDLGALELSLVNLSNLVDTGTIRKGLYEEVGADILSGVVGSTPEDPGVDPGEVLTIFQRTRDPSSNEVVMFDASNIFYGNKIQPESFVISDKDITGSGGRMSMTLRDDGFGNLYRADSVGPHATWASVGNVLYAEGLVVVKDPTVPFFGQEQFAVELSGSSTVHTLKAHVVAQAGTLTSSSNPSFLPISATLNANETDPDFVYLTGVLFMDDNLNVVMRSNFAQPVVKRKGSKVKVITRIDF